MARRMRRVPKEVFLSHASRDRAFVRRLAEILGNHGIATWYSERHIVGSTQWHDEIGQALRRCDWFVIVLTPHAVKSMWVRRELLAALPDRRFDGRIVPSLRKDCDMKRLSWTLPAIQFVDFRGDTSDAMRELLRIWRIRLLRAD